MPQVFSLPFKARAAHPLAGVTVIQIIPDLEVNKTARAAIEIAASLAAAGGRGLVACAGGRLTGELQAKGGVFVLGCLWCNPPDEDALRHHFSYYLPRLQPHCPAL
jgi:hypothetical protein